MTTPTLDELAARTEREAEKWVGTPMHSGLIDIAGRIRAHAALCAASLRARSRMDERKEAGDGE